jgi:oxalate decarboxylase/phosphoglucose isomerase-like protein (cupin superfamily)
VNAAGSITNIAIGEFRTVSIIRSLAGQYRSRHWHTKDSHVLYVLDGRMAYWERELDGKYSDEPVWVQQGEAIYTPPLMIHQSFFPVNTTLISMSKLARDHDSHEADVNRVEEEWQVALVGG